MNRQVNNSRYDTHPKLSHTTHIHKYAYTHIQTYTDTRTEVHTHIHVRVAYADHSGLKITHPHKERMTCEVLNLKTENDSGTTDNFFT